MFIYFVNVFSGMYMKNATDCLQMTKGFAGAIPTAFLALVAIRDTKITVHTEQYTDAIERWL